MGKRNGLTFSALELQDEVGDAGNIHEEILRG